MENILTDDKIEVICSMYVNATGMYKTNSIIIYFTNMLV